jgi:hypothetical protein
MAVRVMHDQLLHTLHRTACSKFYKHQKLLTTAVGCGASNLSQLSVADGRSVLHME